MSDFTPWLRPTLLGPFITTYALTTLGHLLVGMHALSDGRVDGWLLGMLIASFYAATVCVVLIASDIVFLAVGARRLPTGSSAWTTSLIAPFAVWMAWSMIGLGDGDSIPELVVRIAAPLVAVPAALRWLVGARP